MSPSAEQPYGPSRTVGSGEVGERVVALLCLHDVGHHGTVVGKGSETQALDQHVLEVIRVQLEREGKGLKVTGAIREKLEGGEGW